MANEAAIGYVDIAIASGQTTSGEADLSNGRTLAGIIMPGTFTGTALTFTAYDSSGGTFNAIYGDTGTAISVTCAASRYIAVDPAVFAGVRYLKVVSGSSEGGNRTVRLVVRNV